MGCRIEYSYSAALAVLMELYERYLSSELYLFKKISLVISIREESKAALGAAVWVVSQMSLQVAGNDEDVA